jgi:hypothetical protein
MSTDNAYDPSRISGALEELLAHHTDISDEVRDVESQEPSILAEVIIPETGFFAEESPTMLGVVYGGIVATTAVVATTAIAGITYAIMQTYF